MADAARAFERDENAKQFNFAIAQLEQRIKLRQWCIEQAHGDVAAAKNIFAFVTEDISTVLKQLVADDAE